MRSIEELTKLGCLWVNVIAIADDGRGARTMYSTRTLSKSSMAVLLDAAQNTEQQERS